MIRRLLTALALVGGLITHAHAQTFPGQGPLNPIIGVDPTGTVDATTAIHNASAAGGALLPCGTYKIGSTLALGSNAILRGAARGCVTLKWAGSTNSDFIVLNSQTTNAILENLVIDANNTTGITGLHLVDTQNSRFTGLTFQSTGASANSGIAIRLQAGQGGTGSAFNTAFNRFDQIQSVWYANGFQCDGISTGPTVVTLNTITQADFEKVGEGFRLAQWCDNNRFYHVRVETETPNTFGVVNNDSATPAVDVGVYANNFYGLAVDAFGAASNVAAWFSNVSKQNHVYGLYHSPDPFPGTVVVDNLGRSGSHYVVMENIDNTTNAGLSITKNMYAITVTNNLTLANGLNSNITALVGGPRQRITGPTGAFSIGGFSAPTSQPIDGARLVIYNSTAQAMTIVNEDVSTGAGSRIKTLTGANVTLRTGTSFATFSYDATDLRWILESTNGGAL